jgi:hypothetical protein
LTAGFFRAAVWSRSFYPLLDVARQAGRVAVETVGDDAADADRYLLDLGV